MKQAIFVLGMPGAGKSTLSKKIADNTIFQHMEYDKHNDYLKYDNIVFDGFIAKTENLDFVLNEYEGYNVTLIYLNIDKDICKSNILKRKRATIKINKVEYDFNQLQTKHKFDLIEVKNYKVDTTNSTYSSADMFNNLRQIIEN